ncbi:tetratricopeptide repeat protein [bacterium]|nr:tetratricopeptide repeat protein [bacterium]MBU1984974.1 tetratricopeptide repeat protein [bacterium]
MSKVSSAKTRGRLTKKELKQDKLVEYAAKIEHFYRANQKLVIGIAVAIVVVVIGITVARKMATSSSLERSYKLTMAKMNYGSGQLDDARAAFEQVVKTTGGATAAEAQYFLGRVAFEQGNYPEAESQFQSYLNNHAGNKELDCAAMSGLAATMSILARDEEAASMYMKIADQYPNSPYAPQSLMEAERLYVKLNQLDKAKEALKKVGEKYPESSVGAIAKQKLSTMQ